MSGGRRGGTDWLVIFDAPDGVRDRLAQVGRTEDLRFSPSGTLIALACFRHNTLAVVPVDVDVSGPRPAVTVGMPTECGSVLLDQPHGVEFLDEHTVAVANRGGAISIHRLVRRGDGSVSLRDVHLSGAATGLAMPGSLAVTEIAPQRFEFLVCDNRRRSVVRLVASSTAEGLNVQAAMPLLRRRIDLPDGVAASGDGRWIAVSSHLNHRVFIYERSATLGLDTDPVAVLRGIEYPHGVRFSPDGTHLFVTDAGTTYLHTYRRPGAGWAGVLVPASSHTVVNDETFARVRMNEQEGGPKGVDIHPSGRIVAVTAEELPLTFASLDALVDDPGDAGAQALRHELGLISADESSAARAEAIQLWGRALRRQRRRVASAARRAMDRVRPR